MSLQTQGLVNATLTHAKVEATRRGLTLPAEALFQRLFHVEPRTGDLPDTFWVWPLAFVPETPETSAHYVSVSREAATFYAYQSQAIWNDGMNRLTYTLVNTETQAPQSVTPVHTDFGRIMIPFPDETSSFEVFATAPSEGALHFVLSHPTIPDALLVKKDSQGLEWQSFQKYQLTADVSIRSVKGDAISGLKRENFGVNLTLDFEQKQVRGEEFGLSVSVQESPSGAYRLIATVPVVDGGAPTSFQLELAVQNAPLIHDVPYQAPEDMEE